MKIIKTDEYTSMLSNSSEHVVSFINKIKYDSTYLKIQSGKKSNYVAATELYETYKSWCHANNEKNLYSNVKLKEKFIHYGGQGVEYKRIRVDPKTLIYGYILKNEFFEEDKTEEYDINSP
jgi:phage/plasmid-associated DNA primase